MPNSTRTNANAFGAAVASVALATGVVTCATPAQALPAVKTAPRSVSAPQTTSNVPLVTSPTHAESLTAAARRPVKATSANYPTASYYVVRSGDTVSEIAQRYGVKQRTIASANGLRNVDFIRTGQRLHIPSGAAQYTPAPAKPAAAQAKPTQTKPTQAASKQVKPVQAKAPQTKPEQAAQVNGKKSPSKTKIGNTFLGRTYPADVVAAAQRNQDALDARSVPSRQEMQKIVRSTANKHGIPADLAMAISHQESGFNMRSVSPANAIGAMQVVPSSGAWAGNLIGRKLDLTDPHDNATAGVVILKANLNLARNTDEAIAAYYQGLGSVRKKGMYEDTKRYVKNVNALRSRFK